MQSNAATPQVKRELVKGSRQLQLACVNNVVGQITCLCLLQKSVRHYWPVNMPNELKVLVDYTVQMKLPNESVCLETTELSKLSLAKWKQLYQVGLPKQMNGLCMCSGCKHIPV